MIVVKTVGNFGSATMWDHPNEDFKTAKASQFFLLLLRSKIHIMSFPSTRFVKCI